MFRRFPVRRTLPVLVGAVVAFIPAYAINSRSLAWLLTEERGQRLSEPLFLFWTLRLPLTFGLAAIAIGLLIALRRNPEARGAVAAGAVASIAAAGLTWHLYATATQRSLRGVAAVLIIRSVDEPRTFLPFFSDHSDPAGIATDDPAVVARFAGCYDLGGGFVGNPRRRIVSKPERIRLRASPIEHGWQRAAHQFLELEPPGWMAEFWWVENGSAVSVWTAGLSGRTVMIRPDGDGGFIGIEGSNNDITPMQWWHARVQRVPCD